MFAFERNGRVGFIDPTGKIKIEPEIVASIENVGDFSNGLARVHDQGFIDENGRWVIRRDLWSVRDFSDGLALAMVKDSSRQYGFLGLVLDPSGTVVGSVPPLDTRDFSEGLAAFAAKGRPPERRFEPGNFVYRDYPGLEGFLDRTGKVVIEPRFAAVGPFRAGRARAVLDGYCHIATPDGGKEGTPTTGYPSSCGGAPTDAVSPCMVGYIDPSGNFAIESRFESARDFQEGLAAVRTGGQWGFIDRSGALVISPRFEQAQSFREGLAAVMIDGKWGFIDQTGRLTVPPQFEGVEPFSDSLAIARRRGKVFFVDRSGRTAINGPFQEATPFVHGIAAVLLSEKHVAYIDHSGKTVFDYFRP
ncbi:MAG: WG repeat-containing protein [Acidobacteria bacterium]|nr:WG repeat-containing protein [Acidobacteriota bacterium]